MIKVTGITLTGSATAYAGGSPLPPVSGWFAVFNSSTVNVIRGIHVDSDGTLYGTGYESSTGNRDIFLVRLDSDANLVWQKRIDTGSSDDFGTGIAADSSGLYLGSSLDSTPTGTNDFYVTKHNRSDGSIIWQRPMGGADTESVRGIAVDSAGAAYTTGRDGNIIMMTTKHTSSGDFSWVRRRYDGDDSSAFGIAIDSSNRVNVAGVANTSNPALVQYTSAGAYSWGRRYTALGAGQFSSVFTDSSNNIYAVGHVAVTGQSNNMVILSTDSSGTFRWATHIGGTADDRATAVHAVGNRVFVTGYTTSIPSGPNLGKRGIWVAEFSSTGTLIWQRFLSIATSATPNAIRHNGSHVWIGGQVVLDGSSRSLVAKLPDNGQGTGTYGDFDYRVAEFASSTITSSTSSAVSYDGGATSPTTYTRTHTTANTATTIAKTNLST